MSIKVSAPFWHMPFDKPIDKLVFMSIAEDARDDGTMYNEEATEVGYLMDRCECKDKETIIKSRNRLVARGYLEETQKGFGIKTKYRVNLEVVQNRSEKPTGRKNPPVEKTDHPSGKIPPVPVEKTDCPIYKDNPLSVNPLGEEEEETRVSATAFEIEAGGGKSKQSNNPLLDVIEGGLAETVLAILEEVPACNRSPQYNQKEEIRKARIKGVAEFITEQSEPEPKDWVPIARGVRDAALSSPSMREESTFDAAPSKILRDYFGRVWKFMKAGRPQAELPLSPEHQDIRNKCPELWLEVDSMIRKWNSSAMYCSQPSAARTAEYVTDLSRCQISAEHLRLFQEQITREMTKAPRPYSLAQLILARVNENRKVIVLEESVADDIKTSNEETFGTATPSLAEIRSHFKKRFGIDEEEEISEAI